MYIHLRMIKLQNTFYIREGVFNMAEQAEKKKGIGPKVQALVHF